MKNRCRKKRGQQTILCSSLQLLHKLAAFISQCTHLSMWPFFVASIRHWLILMQHCLIQFDSAFFNHELLEETTDQLFKNRNDTKEDRVLTKIGQDDTFPFRPHNSLTQPFFMLALRTLLILAKNGARIILFMASAFISHWTTCQHCWYKDHFFVAGSTSTPISSAAKIDGWISSSSPRFCSIKI